MAVPILCAALGCALPRSRRPKITLIGPQLAEHEAIVVMLKENLWTSNVLATRRFQYVRRMVREPGNVDAGGERRTAEQLAAPFRKGKRKNCLSRRTENTKHRKGCPWPGR